MTTNIDNNNNLDASIAVDEWEGTSRSATACWQNDTGDRKEEIDCACNISSEEGQIRLKTFKFPFRYRSSRWVTGFKVSVQTGQ